MRRILILFIITAIVLSLTACKNKETDTENINGSNISAVETDSNGNTKKQKKTKSKGNITLYFCYSDSLDPYKSQSSGNRALCSLLFDPLVKLDNDLNPHNVLASNVDIDGKTITVSLNGYRFSDGSLIDTEDVIYSIERCKSAKNGAYVNQLENISSYSSSGGKIIITLKRYDKNAVNLLDFPILKKNTHNKTNDDGKSIPPVGSGRYVLVDDFGEFSLKGNEYYFKGQPKNKINLKNIPDFDSLEYLIRSASINIYYNGFDSKEMPELKDSSENVNLTNLVYIGINQKSGVLNDKNIRQALSYAIDRTNISEKCYYSFSKPALNLYNEKNNIKKDCSNIFNAEDNLSKSTDALKISGYKKLGSDGFYINSNKKYISLNLLYNKDNNMQSMAASNIVKQFKACGINVKEDGKTASDYKNLIKRGDYQLYLAEIRLNKSFDYSDLLKFPKNISVFYQKKSDSDKENNKKSNENKNAVNFSEVYQKYMKGDIDIQNMLQSFSEEMPFIPILFRMGTVSCSGSFSEKLISSISDPYYNIENIYLK